jgi:subtilisin family serine protease
MRIRQFVLFTFCLCAALTTSLTAAEKPTGAAPGRYIIRLSSKSDATFVQKSLASSESLSEAVPTSSMPPSPAREILSRYFVYISADSSLTSESVMARFGSQIVESIEPDYFLEQFTFPRDSLVPHQWYLVNNGQGYYGINRLTGTENDSLSTKSGKAGTDVHLRDIYETAPADTEKVVVAIVDTGIDPKHPELRERLWKNLDEIPGNNADDDHNGYVDDTLGYDVSGDRLSLFDLIGDNDPTDSVGHGTHVAGIIAAKADDLGIAGIAPWVEIMPVKIFPNGLVSVGAQGVVYAVSAGAQVINISWGTPFVSGFLQAALQYAREQGVFVCIASGNSGTNQRFYPAAFDSAFVVGAGNSLGFVTEFSTYGSHVDIVAPGLDILSLRARGTDMYAGTGEPGVRIVGSDSSYYLSDGTSMASPMVAGAAAVLWSFRPGLSLAEVESALTLGATDLVDPYGIGDSLPGRDSISGWGYLNIENALSLANAGRLFITSPVRRQRYVGDITIRIASLDDNYSGEWTLEYRRKHEAAWTYLTSGIGIPSDSVATTLTDTEIVGPLYLRLRDNTSASHQITVTRVVDRYLAIGSPVEGEDVSYNIQVVGSAFGPDFDSLIVSYSRGVGAKVRLQKSTAEYFDSLLFNWTVSGIDTGIFTLHLDGYYDMEKITDTVAVHIKSAFAPGWPQRLAGWLSITPVAADIDRDGTKEIIVTTSSGVYVFDNSPKGAHIRDGFPALTDLDVRSIPAIYDLNRDGFDEIIFSSDGSVHAIQHDGTPLDGWPRPAYTGQIPFGYDFPNPTISRLGLSGDSAVVLINTIGQILAYRFSGESHFYSRGGLFSSYDARQSDMWSRGGNSSPVVTSVDVNKDGMNEVVASYTSPPPYSGLGIYESRTGRPVPVDSSTLVEVMIANVDGMVLADLTGDGAPEVVIAGFDNNALQQIWVATNGNQTLPGWPVAMPEVTDWIGSFPTVADLDFDGKGEILQTFFEYDRSTLYIWEGDGTPYRIIPGRPAGEVFSSLVTFSSPMVADIVGDSHPEIIIRSGYIIPGTGPERIYVFDYQGNPVPGWPIITPTPQNTVFSSRYTPLIDDLDGDGKVEMAICGDGGDIFVWECDASSAGGSNHARLLSDNLNSSVIGGFTQSDDEQLVSSERPQAKPLILERLGQGSDDLIVSMDVPVSASVLLELVTANGANNRILYDGRVSPGTQKFSVGAVRDASAFYRLTVNGETTIQRTEIRL